MARTKSLNKSLKWNGKAVSDRMRRAQIAGVNWTMAACVEQAKSNHSWQNQTGTLEGAINIVDYAQASGAGVRGVWGTQDVAYALIHELGGTIVPKSAKALAVPLPDGELALVQSVTIPARPYLRPAADQRYPELARNIRRAYQRSGK